MPYSKNTIRSTINWDLGDLEQFVMLRFPRAHEEAIVESMTLGRDEGLETARMVAHEDTGALRRSGRRVPHFMEAGKHIITFRFGGYETNPKTGRKVDYAHIHEEYLKQTEGRGYVEAGVRKMAESQRSWYKTLINQKLQARRR